MELEQAFLRGESYPILDFGLSCGTLREWQLLETRKGRSIERFWILDCERVAGNRFERSICRNHSSNCCYPLIQRRFSKNR